MRLSETDSIASPAVLLFWGQFLGFLVSLPFLLVEHFDYRKVLVYRSETWLALMFLGAIYFAFTMILPDPDASGCWANYGFSLPPAVFWSTDGGRATTRKDHFPHDRRRDSSRWRDGSSDIRGLVATIGRCFPHISRVALTGTPIESRFFREIERPCPTAYHTFSLYPEYPIIPTRLDHLTVETRWPKTRPMTLS